jgi:hypothetical protein
MTKINKNQVKNKADKKPCQNDIKIFIPFFIGLKNAQKSIL